MRVRKYLSQGELNAGGSETRFGSAIRGASQLVPSRATRLFPMQASVTLESATVLGGTKKKASLFFL